MDIGEVFDELIDNYTENMCRWVPHYLKLVVETIDSVPIDAQVNKILDLGCGNGNVSILATARFPQAGIYLVDASHGMLDVARSRLQGKVILNCSHINIQDLHFNEPNFDLVTACFSLHHLSGQEKQDIFHRIKGWLKSGGFFSYSDLFVEKDDSETHSKVLKKWESFVRQNSNGSQDWDFLSDHYMRYDWPNREAIQQEWLTNAGFSSFKWHRFDEVWAHCLAG